MKQSPGPVSPPPPPALRSALGILLMSGGLSIGGQRLKKSTIQVTHQSIFVIFNSISNTSSDYFSRKYIRGVFGLLTFWLLTWGVEEHGHHSMVLVGELGSGDPQPLPRMVVVSQVLKVLHHQQCLGDSPVGQRHVNHLTAVCLQGCPQSVLLNTHVTRFIIWPKLVTVTV